MKDITLIMPYYMNPGMLKHQLRQIEAMSQEVRDHLRVIVVDDASPTGPAVPRPCGVPLEIYRIVKDVRWNQDAARNIGVHYSQTPWLVLTDIDHEVPESTWRALMRQSHDTRVVYRFARVSAPDMLPYKVHPNSYFMTRETYEKTGGYDERLAGYYGTDGDYRSRVNKVAEVIDMKDPIVRYPREVIPDASTTTYERKSPIDGRLRAVKARRDQIPGGWKPLRMSFEHHRVF